MRLTKHHGLGNDFLVLLDPSGMQPFGPDLARAVCDRHRGIGADGLLRLGPGRDGAALSMVLLNADGGRAEMSGNGISCLVQAAVLAGLAAAPLVTVATDAGMRTVRIEPTAEARTHRVTVDMGAAKVGDDETEWLDDEIIRALRVDVGNPHLVLHAPDLDWGYDLVARGEEINELVPGGINVEIVAAGPGEDELTMRVYERGVGLTEACGTGACAVAAAAVSWGIAGPQVRVHQPGGTAAISVGDTITMTVPVAHVATIEWLG
ncbi:MAG: diaminopimelate epimerase [Acidimicrobiaceae bacterium]|jgi:diaminopimelate epimerase